VSVPTTPPPPCHTGPCHRLPALTATTTTAAAGHVLHATTMPTPAAAPALPARVRRPASSFHAGLHTPVHSATLVGSHLPLPAHHTHHIFLSCLGLATTGSSRSSTHHHHCGFHHCLPPVILLPFLHLCRVWRHAHAPGWLGCPPVPHALPACLCLLSYHTMGPANPCLPACLWASTLLPTPPPPTISFLHLRFGTISPPNSCPCATLATLGSCHVSFVFLPSTLVITFLCLLLPSSVSSFSVLWTFFLVPACYGSHHFWVGSPVCPPACLSCPAIFHWSLPPIMDPSILSPSQVRTPLHLPVHVSFSFPPPHHTWDTLYMYLPLCHMPPPSLPCHVLLLLYPCLYVHLKNTYSVHSHAMSSHNLPFLLCPIPAVLVPGPPGPPPTPAFWDNAQTRTDTWA